MKKYLPDLLTLLNLLCGVCAAILALWGWFWQGFCLILAGAVFDLCDGALARLLGVSSQMGRELDSLSDLISFGLAPALMLFAWYFKINCNDTPQILAFVPLLIVPFSAIRLARFNLEESGDSYFTGLPTPACAMLAASLVAYGHCCTVAGAESLVVNLLRSGWFIPVLSAVLCILLVSRIKMLSLKGKISAKHYILAGGALLFVAAIALVAPRGIAAAGYIALFLAMLFTAYILLAIVAPKK